MEGRGEGRGLFCCQKLPYLSTILSPVVGSKLEDASPPPYLQVDPQHSKF